VQKELPADECHLLQEIRLSLAVQVPALPPTAPDVVYKLRDVQMVEMEKKQVPIYTEHLLHAGMYSRTITMPPNVKLIGAFIKIPTLVTVVGTARVLVGKEWVEVDGYAVLPASAGRKQIFVSKTAVIISMAFPTKVQTIEQAEREFTDEAEILLSRRQDLNKVTITGE
jgi:hypothetical protein